MFRSRRKQDSLPAGDIIEGEIEELEAEAPPAPPPPSAPAPRERRRALLGRRQSAPPNADNLSEAALQTPRFALKLPRLLAWEEIQPGLFFWGLVLVAGGVFWTLHNLGATSGTSLAWYPMVGLVLAALWALWSLALRRAEAFLAACALVGACLSLWLDAQDFIDWRQTLVGLMLMALGVGIIGRGLVLRGQGS